jgi:hypothetical protein
MSTTITALRPAEAARGRRCPLCRATPNRPCQAKPSADHLAPGGAE